MVPMKSPQMQPDRYQTRGKKLLYLFAGLLFFGWLIYTPSGLLGKADAVGYAVCHRFDFRSFWLGDRPLPLCARCSGMYLGAVLGLVYYALISRRKSGYPALSSWIILGLFVIGFGVDGLNSLLSLLISDTLAQVNPGLYQMLTTVVIYQPQNWLRLFTGTGMGLVMASIIYPAFNQTVWKDTNSAPVVTGPLFLAPLIGLALLLDLAILTENPLLLYPLALISAGGVLLLLSMIYTMVVLMLFKFENRYVDWKQLIFPFTAGFCVALAQIFLIDLARFAITQTWGGFPLP